MAEKMSFGLAVAAEKGFWEAVEKAVEAERLGLGYVWFFDRPCLVYPPLLAEAAASQTSKLKLGLGLSPLLHSPADIASTMETLLKFYGERFELCLIPGDKVQLSRVGVSLDRPGEALNLILKAREKIKERLKAEGFSCRVWLGAQGPEMLKIAGRFDGLLLNAASRKLVEWSLKESNLRVEGGFQLGIIASSYVYENFREEVYRILRRAAAVAALGASKRLKKLLGFPEWLKQASLTEETVEKLPREIAENFAIFLEAEKLGDYVASLKRLGVSHLVFSHPQDFSKETIGELASALKRLSSHG